jgi:hypothetical protein
MLTHLLIDIHTHKSTHTYILEARDFDPELEPVRPDRTGPVETRISPVGHVIPTGQKPAGPDRTGRIF